MPTTAMPATIAPPAPESDGGSSSGVVSREYVGSGVGLEGVSGVGLAEGDVGEGVGVADVRARDVGEAVVAASTVTAVVPSGEGESADGVAGVALGFAVRVGSAVRVGWGLGVGWGDFDGAGSSMTSAQPLAG